jgi:hypothetical protein
MCEAAAEYISGLGQEPRTRVAAAAAGAHSASITSGGSAGPRFDEYALAGRLEVRKQPEHD